MNAYETLVTKVKRLVPVYSRILNAGASNDAIDQFLKAIKLDVPDSFIQFYKVCDGGEYEETVDIESMSFLSLKYVMEDKKMFDNILEKKQRDNEFFYWHKDWLPFADNHGYDTIAIDTSGMATGRKGCVLKRSKDLFEGEPMSILAPDFKTFITGWAKRVEEEQVYSFSEKTDDGKNRLIDEGEYYYNDDNADEAHYMTTK